MKTYATVCSGVEGCSLALTGMDWKPIFFSEIEPFPCAVLKAYYPNVPNLGDMSKISYDATKGIITNGKRNVQFSGRLDLLAGGTPCQDFSVAGKRAGGAEGSGTRSSLMWQWLRLAAELRPRTLLWENVVGCLSSNEGRDFAQFVAVVGELGYCVSWRVLDCQYVRTLGTSTQAPSWLHAIPQRRRRVWLVGCADAEPSETAEILFEPRSLVGNTPPRRRSREEASRTAQDRNPLHARVVEGFFDNQRTGFPTTGEDVNHTVCSKNFYQGVIESIALEGNGQRPSHRGSGINADGAQFTLNCIEQHGVAYSSQKVYNNEGMGGETEVTNMLDCSLAKVCSTQQPIITETMVFDPRTTAVSGEGATSVEVDLTQTANQHKDPHCIIECYENHLNNSRITESGDCVQTLTQRIGTGGGNLPIVTCYEHHGQDARCSDLDGKPCPTLGTTASNHPLKGNNPLVCEAVPFVKTTHARGKDGEGERWEQCEVVGTRNVFDVGESRAQEVAVYRIDALSSNSMKSANPNSGIHEVAVAQTLDTTTPTPVKNQGGDVIVEGVDGYNQSLTGKVSPTVRAKSADADHVPLVISNSNGGDVMPTISANEAKLGGDNQHIVGGGTLCINFEMYDVGQNVGTSLCAKRAHDTMVVADNTNN